MELQWEGCWNQFSNVLLAVFYLLRDESLSGSDITSKLEPAFLSGLRCSQPLIRAKFFEVFDASMKRRVYERLLYICCSQNWEAMGSHFWIKQCTEVKRAMLLLDELTLFKMHFSLWLILCSAVCLYTFVLFSFCWQCVRETPSSAPAVRDPCCRPSPMSSTWPTAMTELPSPWRRMSSRSHVRGRTARPRRRWGRSLEATHGDTNSHTNLSRLVLDVVSSSIKDHWLNVLSGQDVEIDIELAPGDQTAIPKTKEQAERDTGNQLHMLTNRHDKFLDSLREVKVRSTASGTLMNPGQHVF